MNASKLMLCGVLCSFMAHVAPLPSTAQGSSIQVLPTGVKDVKPVIFNFLPMNDGIRTDIGPGAFQSRVQPPSTTSLVPAAVQQILPPVNPQPVVPFTFDPSTTAARNFDTFKRPTADDLVDRDHTLDSNILKALQPDHPTTGTTFNPLATPKQTWLRAPAGLTDVR